MPLQLLEQVSAFRIPQPCNLVETRGQNFGSLGVEGDLGNVLLVAYVLVDWYLSVSADMLLMKRCRFWRLNRRWLLLVWCLLCWKLYRALSLHGLRMSWRKCLFSRPKACMLYRSSLLRNTRLWTRTMCCWFLTYGLKADELVRLFSRPKWWQFCQKSLSGSCRRQRWNAEKPINLRGLSR
jgi:hypothetical protein